jgi:hypothetical protein
MQRGLIPAGTLLFFVTVPLATQMPLSAQVSGSTVQNTNPNYIAIREYGRIERNGANAILVAGSSRPLDMAAYTLSTCLGLSVSAEDPRYTSTKDLLDVTAPQFLALHPDGRHVYAGRPGKIEVHFTLNENGQPEDIDKLLTDAAEQGNAQSPWSFKVLKRTVVEQDFYTFVPTRYRDAAGEFANEPAYLDTIVDVPRKTSRIWEFAKAMTDQMSDALGMDFSCCQVMVVGHPWGGNSIEYGANRITARMLLQDLLAHTGNESYSLRCEPLDKRFCFINVRATSERLLDSGRTCSAPGYDAR